MKDIPVLWYSLFIVVLCTLLASTQLSALEAEGSSTSKKLSLQNAYVSAHFKCNRKGLWTDLNTLKVQKEYTTQYTITGGKIKITEYRTKVEFECTTDYKKVPDEG